jgi:hypothetical protein
VGWYWVVGMGLSSLLSALGMIAWCDTLQVYAALGSWEAVPSTPHTNFT